MNRGHHQKGPIQSDPRVTFLSLSLPPLVLSQYSLSLSLPEVSFVILSLPPPRSPSLSPRFLFSSLLFLRHTRTHLTHYLSRSLCNVSLSAFFLAILLTSVEVLSTCRILSLLFAHCGLIDCGVSLFHC